MVTKDINRCGAAFAGYYLAKHFPVEEVVELLKLKRGHGSIGMETKDTEDSVVKEHLREVMRKNAALEDLEEMLKHVSALRAFLSLKYDREDCNLNTHVGRDRVFHWKELLNYLEDSMGIELETIVTKKD